MMRVTLPAPVAIVHVQVAILLLVSATLAVALDTDLHIGPGVGRTVLNPDSTYTLYDSIAEGDPWSNSLTFFHAATPRRGDFSATVRVVGQTELVTGFGGSAGIMARADLAVDDAEFALAQARPGIDRFGNMAPSLMGRVDAGTVNERFESRFGHDPIMGIPPYGESTPIWLRLDRIGDEFFGWWSRDDNGAPGQWVGQLSRQYPEFGESVYLGLGHSAPFDSAADPGAEHGVTFDNWSVTTDPVFPSLPLASPFLDDLGQAGGNGYWDLRMVYLDDHPLRTIWDAEHALLEQKGTIVTAQVPILNFADVGNPGNGYSLPQPKTPLPDDSDGDTNSFVWLANGNILVPEPGIYTFGFDGDDGQMLKVEGAQFTFKSGSGMVVPATPADTLQHAWTTGDAYTLASTFLTSGVHKVQLLGFENVGGAFFEVFAAQGDHASISSGQFLPLGDETVIPSTTISPLVKLVGPANVHNSDFQHNIALARDEIMNNGIENGLHGVTDVLLLQGAGAAEHAAVNDTVLFPNGGGDPNRNVDWFTTGVFGEFQVDDGDEVPDEALDLTFGLFADENAQLRIRNADFTGVAGDERVVLVDVDGDCSLTADFPTTNTNALGHITLTEGRYDFEVFHLEREGEAHLEIFAAAGFIEAFDGRAFWPINTSADDIVVAGATGLRLVEPRQSSPYDLNGDGAINSADIDRLMTAIAMGSDGAALDVNFDGQVDESDRDAWLASAAAAHGFSASYLLGDANLDGVVDALDLNQVGIHWQSDVAEWTKGNFTAAGVDARDLNALGSNWNSASSAAADVRTVPTPAGLAPLALGGLVVLTLRRKWPTLR